MSPFFGKKSVQSFIADVVSVVCFSLLLCTPSPAQNVQYVNLNDDNAMNRTINTSKPVGATQGSAGVSASGGATYSIPIAVPPGTNGMEPSLALTYNSQAGNGIAGYGWGISGLSSITRVSKNWYEDDNVVAPVMLDNTDALALDGQRLISVNGTNGVGAEYRTEVESYCKITMPIMNNGILIETKDGLTKEYGTTANSRVLNEEATVIVEWKLNRISDKFGNYIDFKYQNLASSFSKAGQTCIAEIDYTGNTATGLSPYNKIVFSYSTRRDKNVTYQSGVALPSEWLVDGITIYGENNSSGENTFYKNYLLKYAYDNLYSVLNEVAETGADLQMLNSTVFEYGKADKEYYLGMASYDLQSSIPSNASLMIFYTGDYNGDGFTDVLASSYDYSGTYNNDYKIYLHNSNDSWTAGATGLFDGNFNIVKTDQTRYKNFFGFISSDYDGDGSDDFIASKLADNGTLERINVYNVIHNGQIVQSRSISSPDFNVINPNGNSIYTGDFNGDYRMDIMTILGNTYNSYRAYISFPALNQDNSRLYFPSISINSVVQSDKIYVIDFDGDGKQELMTIKDNTTNIYSIQKNGNDYDAVLINSSGYPTKWNDIYFGDFNGDKKTDILTRFPYLGWSVGYSNGKEFTETLLNWGTATYNKLITGDYNRDGKSDILRTSTTSDHKTKIEILLSNGTFFETRINYQEPNPLPSVWLPFDFNGDGQQDILTTDNFISVPIMFCTNSKERLLKKVSNGLNKTTDIDYSLLTTGTTFYTQNMSSSYPVNVVRPGAYMVSSFKTDNGTGSTHNYSYQYKNALYHRAGRGFMGFLTTVQKDEAMGTTTEREYDLNTTFYATALKRTTTSLTNGGQQIWQGDNGNLFVSLGGKRFVVTVPLAREQNLLGGTTKYTLNAFDTNTGNITSSITDNAGIESTTTNISYTQAGSWLAYNKPAQISTTITRSGSPAISTTTSFQYNTTTGALTSKTDFSGAGQDCEVTTGYAYDAFGNVKQQTTTASGQPTLINRYGYEQGKGRFLLNTTNPNNQTATYTYHPLWGKVTSYTGIDGLTTNYTYDNFGRLKTAVVPQGYTINTSYVWDVQQGQTGVYYTNTQDPGSPDTKVWYDKAGREVQRQTEGFNGNWTTEKTQYDARGNVFVKTRPYYTNETPLTTAYLYDSCNRPSFVWDYSGVSRYDYTYSAGNLKTSLTNPAGQITSTTTDPTGKVISSTDPNGTMNFTYDGFGNVLTSRSGSTTLVQNTYNACGRQTGMTDKNAGVNAYQYNAYGQLHSQTTPNGTQTYTYNNLGQITTQTINGLGAITYEYYPTGQNGVNQLKTVTNYNGYTQQYTYDQYSRPTNVQETIDGLPFSKTVTYDVYDNPTRVSYSSGLILNRQYDANGYLKNIKENNSTAIYTVNSMTGLGQCNSYTLGNGKTTTVTYQNGLPTRFQTPNIMDLQLGVNFANGNITYRKDNLRNLTENFGYDANERLTSAQVGTLPALTMTYSDNGNIASKSDVGNYTYDNTHINAVKQVSNPNTVIPNQQQDIVYSPFGQPTKVTENGKELDIFYGADGLRRKSILKNTANDNPVWTRYYLGDYEQQITPSAELGSVAQNYHYIRGVDGTIVCIAIKQGTNPTAFHYTYTDHLGSILAVTNGAGTVEAEQNFDAWGRKRNPANWTYTNVPTNWLYRGFTGHEYLPEFNLINMNGRMYDPLLGRMLSPDNYVQNPFSTQGFNRYSYCANNPLKYIDPSGEADGNEYFTDSGPNGPEGNDEWNEFFSTGFGATSTDWEQSRNSRLGGLTSADWGFGDEDVNYWGDYGESMSESNAEWAWADTKPTVTIKGIGGIGYFHSLALTNMLTSNDFLAGNGEMLARTVRSKRGSIDIDYTEDLVIKGNRGNGADIEGAFWGLGLEVGGDILSGSTIRFFNQRGTNFSPKLYTTGWQGGSVGQIRTYSTTGVAKALGAVGYGLGLLNYRSNYQKAQQGEINSTQYWIEQGSNTISTFGGLFGAGWGIGWEIGRGISTRSYYRQNIRPVIQDILGVPRDEY